MWRSSVAVPRRAAVRRRQSNCGWRALGVGALLGASSAVARVKRREKEGGRPLKQKGKAGSRHKGKQKGGAAAKPRRFSNIR